MSKRGCHQPNGRNCVTSDARRYGMQNNGVGDHTRTRSCHGRTPASRKLPSSGIAWSSSSGRDWRSSACRQPARSSSPDSTGPSQAMYRACGTRILSHRLASCLAPACSLTLAAWTITMSSKPVVSTEDVTLAPAHVLASIAAARGSPFFVVLVDWPSMIAAEGLTLRPACFLTRPRRMSRRLICSARPGSQRFHQSLR